VATHIFVQGLDPIELAEDESFNKARHRLNKALKNKIDYENGSIDGESKGQEFEPAHALSFATAEGGRITVNPEKIIGFGSDEPKD
jgi:hypothetical protein